MYVCTSSDIRDWVPKPDLNRSIKRFFDELCEQDGTFWSHYARDSIFSKYASPDPESLAERVSAAYLKLWSTEQRNSETNWRLRNSKDFEPYYHMASAKILEILGDCDLNRVFKHFDFSNGASHAFTREDSDAYNKFNSRSYVTNDAKPYLYALYKMSPVLERESVLDGFSSEYSRTDIALSSFLKSTKLEEPQLAHGNMLFTVPKNDRIERVCAKEPDWNMFFQKGFGGYIRHRLKKISGIDLNDQSINQSLAREGSINNMLATLDLSAASDSMTTELVYKLLPTDWYNHLDAIRSKGTIKDDKYHYWQLFSTMGNGFTFELESLIFYSLAWSVCYLDGIKGRISIYGDDIICPSKSCDTLIALLNHAGFIINTDKSFVEGPFRESCGGHYYNGNDVTPIYIKQPIETLHDFILFRNKFLLWSSNFGHKYLVVDPRCRKFLASLDSQLTKFRALCDPNINLSGTTIICDSFGGKRLVPKTAKKKINQRGAYCYKLLTFEQCREKEINLSRAFTKYRVRNNKRATVFSEVSWRFNPN